MFHTLTQYVKADELERKRLLELSLRLAGVLAAAILVFVALYFFVASLEVPLIDRGSAPEPAIVLDATVTSPSGGMVSLSETTLRRASPWES